MHNVHAYVYLHSWWAETKCGSLVRRLHSKKNPAFSVMKDCQQQEFVARERILHPERFGITKEQIAMQNRVTNVPMYVNKTPQIVVKPMSRVNVLVPQVVHQELDIFASQEWNGLGDWDRTDLKWFSAFSFNGILVRTKSSEAHLKTRDSIVCGRFADGDGVFCEIDEDDEEDDDGEDEEEDEEGGGEFEEDGEEEEDEEEEGEDDEEEDDEEEEDEEDHEDPEEDDEEEEDEEEDDEEEDDEEEEDEQGEEEDDDRHEEGEEDDEEDIDVLVFGQVLYIVKVGEHVLCNVDWFQTHMNEVTDDQKNGLTAAQVYVGRKKNKLLNNWINAVHLSYQQHVVIGPLVSKRKAYIMARI